MEDTIYLVRLENIQEETGMIVGLFYSRQCAFDKAKETLDKLKGIQHFDVLTLQEIEIMKDYTFISQPAKETFPAALLV